MLALRSLPAHSKEAEYSAAVDDHQEQCDLPTIVELFDRRDRAKGLIQSTIRDFFDRMDENGGAGEIDIADFREALEKESIAVLKDRLDQLSINPEFFASMNKQQLISSLCDFRKTSKIDFETLQNKVIGPAHQGGHSPSVPPHKTYRTYFNCVDLFNRQFYAVCGSMRHSSDTQAVSWGSLGALAVNAWAFHLEAYGMSSESLSI